jgi:hypothetical protein
MIAENSYGGSIYLKIQGDEMRNMFWCDVEVKGQDWSAILKVGLNNRILWRLKLPTAPCNQNFVHVLGDQKLPISCTKYDQIHGCFDFVVVIPSLFRALPRRLKSPK